MSLQYLHWELHCLSRAVGFSNLSTASSHVGMSQPQLSRIFLRLEEETGLALLDRTSKRKSHFTKDAFDLADLYIKTLGGFRGQVEQLIKRGLQSHLRVASLEGLSTEAYRFADFLFTQPEIQTVEIDVHDLTDLESHYQRGDYEFVFTSRLPTRAKLSYVHEIGFQTVTEVKRTGKYESMQVLSNFEFNRANARPHKQGSRKKLVSNSLHLRVDWLEKMGGSAHMPSAIMRTAVNKPETVPVLLVGAQGLSLFAKELFQKWKRLPKKDR